MSLSHPQKQPCPVCGEQKNISLIAKQRFEQQDADYFVSICNACSFIHQNPAWDDGFYDGLYTHLCYDPTFHKWYPSQVERYRLVAKRIRALLPKNETPRILDYGSYDGSFIQWLQAHTDFGKQAEIVGYDIYLQNIPEGASFYNDLEKLEGAEKPFHIVVLNHTLEHVPFPVQCLRRIKDSLLGRHGHIVVEVPDISFIRENDVSPFHVQHTNYFTPRTLLRAFEEAGLATIFLETIKNWDIARDPESHCTVLAVGEKSPEYIPCKEALLLQIQSRQKRLQHFLESKGKSTMNIVGAGDALYTLYSLLPKNITLREIFDNDKRILGKRLFSSREVRPVESIKQFPADYIFICTLNKHNYEQILKQLTGLGFASNSILSLFDF